MGGRRETMLCRKVPLRFFGAVSNVPAALRLALWLLFSIQNLESKIQNNNRREPLYNECHRVRTSDVASEDR
jgi:hypothetical protein